MSKTKKKKKIYQKPTEEQLSYLRNKSKVKNTHRSTQNWINKFQEYRSDVRLEGAPEDIDDTSKLETQLCEYFTVAKKNDGSEYTVSSLLSAIRQSIDFTIRILVKSNLLICATKSYFLVYKILIPANNPKIIADYEKYFSKRPVDADPGFYLYPIDI
ncbi:16517_t:CDS:2, partial [Racocetra persica]